MHASRTRLWRLRAALLVVAAAAASTIAATAAPRAAAGPGIQVGIFDDPQILHGDPATVFPLLQRLNTDVGRVTLWWGGDAGVARARPTDATDPTDPAYDWSAYDRLAVEAKRAGITVLFTLLGTPVWANGGIGWNRAPTDPADLTDFARAAARRYNGMFRTAEGRKLPAVKRWLVWNEPNNPVFLKPQFVREAGRWVARSARVYAGLCNAAVAGIRSGQAAAKIACGATAPRGNNNPSSSRPSISPLPFLKAMRAAGARGFDAYAHHPYYGKRQETPSTPPPPGLDGVTTTAVTLGNLDVLEQALDKTYGSRMRLWITEYGYQTNPPDPTFGVTPSKQRAYVTQAYTMLRDDPRIDLFIWFLLRDEEQLTGWQSGLFTADGKAKPARTAFASLAAS
jgi:hypothetical protein